MLINGQQIRIWKEAIMALFKALSHDLPENNQENHENLQSGYLVA
jgi:hypothetical protein